MQRSFCDVMVLFLIYLSSLYSLSLTFYFLLLPSLVIFFSQSLHMPCVSVFPYLFILVFLRFRISSQSYPLVQNVPRIVNIFNLPLEFLSEVYTFTSYIKLSYFSCFPFLPLSPLPLFPLFVHLLVIPLSLFLLHILLPLDVSNKVSENIQAQNIFE